MFFRRFFYNAINIEKYVEEAIFESGRKIEKNIYGKNKKNEYLFSGGTQ